MIDIDDFMVEVSCEYKGENYSVRDNGAVMRHHKKGCRKRLLDGKWTFGKKDKSSGYMVFTSNIRVHQIVAYAFWGDQKREGMIVDHKDTNRCNNRAENLHWVTRLENALNNPITRKKIIIVCGSVENFLENPALLRENSISSNLKWMRTVSKEEAANCKAKLERWSQEDSENIGATRSNGFGEWVYKETQTSKINVFNHDQSQISKQGLDTVECKSSILRESSTSNAMQEGWKTSTEFPLCPNDVLSLDAYYYSLEKGKVFSKNIYGICFIVDFAISEEKQQICVASYNPNGMKKWFITYIYILNDKYIHKNGGSFFEKNGALKTIVNFQGEEWIGGACIDDYC